ncbi:hypothetical protein INT46_005624 [Mucor plumbeus]|uniref:Uncharacterized protein n=1 Tax=Mucor plumbeus TaxID=97098 RepID=A0A8H7UMU5_9FUNG|nr:hypothetical protein INT46_005624 [Mucor plumbeus]
MDWQLALLTCETSVRWRTVKTNVCQQIFGSRPYTSTNVMLHIINLPSIKDCIAILQEKFIYRSLSLLGDSLLMKMLLYLQSIQAKSKWFKIANLSFWKTLADQSNNMNPVPLNLNDLDFSDRAMLLNYRENIPNYLLVADQSWQ